MMAKTDQQLASASVDEFENFDEDLNSSKEMALSKCKLRRSISQPTFQGDIMNHRRIRRFSESELAMMMNKIEKIDRTRGNFFEEFYGVYCLVSKSPSKYFKNRCYVGFTVDPNRRIRQHNAGKQFGGANKTDRRGPWDMVLIVHGFPNNISGLRFEWAWQNPDKSRRLSGLSLKKHSRESAFAFRFRVVCNMLNCHPWRRLALTLRWLMPEYEIIPILPLPNHITIEHGKLEKAKILVDESLAKTTCIDHCTICKKSIENMIEFARCSECSAHYHTVCLAKSALLSNNEYDIHLIPIGGSCSICRASFLWGVIMRDQRTVMAMIDSSCSVCKTSQVRIPYGKFLKK